MASIPSKEASRPECHEDPGPRLHGWEQRAMCSFSIVYVLTKNEKENLLNSNKINRLQSEYKIRKQREKIHFADKTTSHIEEPRESTDNLRQSPGRLRTKSVMKLSRCEPKRRSQPEWAREFLKFYSQQDLKLYDAFPSIHLTKDVQHLSVETNKYYLEHKRSRKYVETYTVLVTEKTKYCKAVSSPLTTL